MTSFLITLLSVFAINTANSSMVFEAEKGSELKIVYYGNRLNNPYDAVESGFRARPAYPAYGLIGDSEAAVSVIYPDGNMTLKLAVTDCETAKWDGGEIFAVTSQDTYYPLTVKTFYKTYYDLDMIETWVEITNGAKKPVVLTRFDSGHLPFRGGDTWISTLYGAWANEGRVNTEPLTRGMKYIRNLDGVRNSQGSHAEVMISLDGKPRENDGRIIGAALCWGGNYELRFQVNNSDYNHFFAGICPDNSEYHLEKGETFATPVLAYTFSDKGLSGASRNFHKWGRQYRLAHGNRERDILLNSWEGVYFKITEKGMAQMMEDIASMGGELFVMDDGWFGGKYPRKNGTSSLGDWVVDREKLPNGVAGLVKTASEKGVKFGIWVEPEMVSTVSELYEKHPDWVIKGPNREPVTGRGGTQLVLDLSRKDVQDYIFDVVDGLMTENPDIHYIKWDSNMKMTSHGSGSLKHQSHLNIEYWRGFAKVCDRIRAKYPDLIIQACASGGGRANWGVLPWFDEFWVSDNTDALQRIYMQWGTSYFFPAIAMASHISATPNHTVRRTTSLKYRIDVAMAGRLGMEIQPKDMSEAEKDLCRKAIADYKTIRPTVQLGDIYRLVSPYDGKDFASMMYVSENKEDAVFYWWKTETFHGEVFPRVRMAGLDPDRMYKVYELNRIDLKPLNFEGKSFSGKFLMDNGLEIPYTHKVASKNMTDWSSRVLHLVAE